jgi:hypothetical protein
VCPHKLTTSQDGPQQGVRGFVQWTPYWPLEDQCSDHSGAGGLSGVFSLRMLTLAEGLLLTLHGGLYQW